MLKALLCLKSLNDSGVDEELAISEDTSMDSVAIFLTLLLLDRIDSDTLHLRAELVIHSECILLRDSLPNASLVLGHLTLTFGVELAESPRVASSS